MKVDIHEFDVDMVLKNNGLTMQVRDNDDRYLGKLRVGKAKIEWCAGKTRIGNGHKVSWAKLIEFFESK